MKLAILLVFLFLVGIYATPSLPQIAPEFFSNISVALEIGGTAYDGFMYFSSPASAMITSLINDQGIGYVANSTTLSQYNSSWLFISGACKPSSGYFFDLFSWLPYANYSGQVEYNGQEYEYWSFNYSSQFLGLLNMGNTPVQLVNIFQSSPNVSETVVYNFYDFTPQNLSSTIFETPEQCLGNGFYCPPSSPVMQEMFFVYYHPTDDYSLNNKNVADIAGDTSFICGDGYSSWDQLISLVKVSVNTSWGSYALCNSNSCQTLNLLAVGREASFGIGEMSGQCSENEQIGSWYSLTQISNCDDPNAEICAWREIGLLKTISVDCLLSQGFFDACDTDGGIPYASAQMILTSAFESDDTNIGGCPSVNATEAKEMNHNTKIPRMSSLGGIQFAIDQSHRWINKILNEFKLN